MHTQILFRDDARAKLLAGASILADAVRVTLGPKSKSVLIEKKFGAPLVCNDGVTAEKIGLRILRLALEAPARQIGENSGVDGGVVVEKIRTANAPTGFDAAAGDYVDMFERGIIDPLKVMRIALENAASVAGVLLLSEATLTEIEEKSEEPQPVEV